MRDATGAFRASLVAALAMLCSLAMASARGAEVRDFDEVVRGYLVTALQSNLALREQALNVEQSAAALAAARAHFLPELSLEARYTRAQGGRAIDFPVGQLLNPAYQTLNALLAAQGQRPVFGTVQDQSFLFQRTEEQDTRVTLRQALYQPAIPAAVAAQRELLGSQRFAQVALARQLRRDVIVAFASYLRALRTTEIVHSALSLLEENLRVTESLLRNGRVTEEQMLRARAELLATRQQLRESEGGVTQARAYLNFLLNQPLDSPLEDAAPGGALALRPADVQSLKDEAVERRAELAQLDALAHAAQARIDVARAALKPRLSLGVDAGTQGEQYRFMSGNNFVAASLVLSWKFFDGGANRAELAEARIAARNALLQREETAQRVQLEVQQALDRLETTQQSLATALAREEAARATLRIASRKRDEGVISQVEFIDARNTLTSAELNLNVTRFELVERTAELEYATGTGDLPPLPTAQKDLP